VLTLARICSAQRRAVLIGWVAVLVGVGFGWQAIGSHYANNFTLGHTGAQRAADLLQSAFPSQAGDSDQIVFQTRSGRFDDAAMRAAVAPMLARVAKLPHVTGVISPYDPGSGERISSSGTIAFATVAFDERANVLPEAAIKKVIATAEAIRSARLDVELGGQAIEQTEFAKPTATTAIGVLAAIVVLLVSFGSFLAMGLPILTALFGLGTGISLVGLVSHVLGMPNFSIELGAMIGLGVGIDYALFILSRYREIYRENGGQVMEAVALAMDTAGRAVLFAGATVVIALLGMFALGVSFLYGLAIAASLAVLLVLAASITLLPALLTSLGRRVGEPGRLARRFSRRRGEQPRIGFWARWIGIIQRRPAVAALAATALMLALAAPALSLRLGSSDSGTDPASFTTRHAFDLLAKGFGPGFNGPLSLVVKLPGRNDAAALTRIAAAVRRVPDVASVAPPRLSPAGNAAVLSAYPASSPQSSATTTLVKELRGSVLPPLEAATGAQVFVGGPTAIFIDFSTVLSSKLWLFIAVVVALSALLLLVVFRSLLIPLQAAVMNLLSIGAALGVIVAAFQFGWLPGAASGPIDAFVPVLMFAIVFGLSMDYEVFLVSRIHEEWGRQGDASAAVRDGVAGIELFGLGLASAVFIDALVIRCILLPAVLELLGPRAWYFPSWLDHRLPRLAIEHGERAPHPPIPRPALDEA
jgi:RND superfamily putative drug exporter